MRRIGRLGALLTVTLMVAGVAPGEAAVATPVPRAAGGLVAGFGVKGTLAVPLNPKVGKPGQWKQAVLAVAGGRFRVVSSGLYPPANPETPYERLGFISVSGYLSNGTPDPAFNHGKARVLDVLSSGEDDATGYASAGVDAAGRVYLLTSVGHTGISGDAWVRRLRADGTVDSAYNAKVYGGPSAYGLAVRADGSTLVCYNDYGPEHWYVAAFTAAGTVDTSFGTGEEPGVAAFPVSAGFPCTTLTADATGSLFVGGVSRATPQAAPSATVFKLTTEGKPAPDWGTAGAVTLAGAAATPVTVTSIRVSAAGTVYAGGAAVVGSEHRPYVARLTGAGALDAAFGTGGIRTFGLPRRTTASLAVASGGRLYLGFGPETYYDIGKVPTSVLRIDAATGAVDTSWATKGAVVYGLANRDAVAVPLTSTRVLVGLSRYRSAGRYGPVIEARSA